MQHHQDAPSGRLSAKPPALLITQPNWGRSDILLGRCWGHTCRPMCLQSGSPMFARAECPRFSSESNSAFLLTQRQMGDQDPISFITTTLIQKRNIKAGAINLLSPGGKQSHLVKYSISLSSAGQTVQDPQRMPETADSTKPCTYYFSPMRTHL